MLPLAELIRDDRRRIAGIVADDHCTTQKRMLLREAALATIPDGPDLQLQILRYEIFVSVLKRQPRATAALRTCSSTLTRGCIASSFTISCFRSSGRPSMSDGATTKSLESESPRVGQAKSRPSPDFRPSYGTPH